MGSFKGKGRNQGRDPRRGAKDRRFGALKFESLEDRVLLATTPWQPTTTNLADVKHGPMADAGQDLINIYQAFLTQTPAQVASQFSAFEIQGSTVGVDVNWNGSGDFNTYLATLTKLGMQISSNSATSGVAEGYLPMAQLPTVAEEPQTLALSAITKPLTSYVGLANNEADASLKADTARQQFGVDGTGVTVGVLSDSVNQAANPSGRPPGLAGSVASGDLPSNVQVLTDGVPGDEDEGRAMLENIHDIAPGASLAFDTADGGPLTFGQHIQALATQAHANVIVDDIRYSNDPFFQDGYIGQGVNAVVNSGVTYVAAAHNEGNGGYLSQYRGTQATVGVLGTGSYMNFDPSGGVTTELPITINQPNTEIVMQYDQPYKAQEPVGSTADVTSDLDFYILDQSGNIVAASVNNNLATHAPYEFLSVPTAGSYFAVIQKVSGPDPGHVEFVQFSQAGLNNLVVSQQFGSAGGTYYPSTFGHNATPNTIGVGAVPWWAPTPFLGQTPLASEPFSSFGPALSVFNPDGTPKSSPQLVMAPVISGADGGNTSFFGPTISTTNPPFAGQPTTPTNLSQDLPSFFGTSSAAPNIAAVVALMKQLNPTLTPATVRASLIAGAAGTPLNGAAPGTWNPQGGYGFVDATAALNAVDELRVLSTTPTNGAVATLSPGTITLTFNRPVNFSTVNASDLVFNGAPANVSPTVGAPIAVDNPQFPTVIAFPITLTLTNPGATPLANGLFSYVFQGAVVSEDNKPLIPFTGTFNLQATDGPRVINTSVSGRVISIQFNEGLQPSTINRSTLAVVRAGGVNKAFFQPTVNVTVSSDPRTQFLYNPVTDTVSIDLSQLDQNELPTDKYAIVVEGANGAPAVLNQAGLGVDGEFNGNFPSGNGVAGGSFVQDIGIQTLAAPVITGIKMDPASDSGIGGDENTNIPTPLFDGQVSANFPGTLAGLTVVAEFSSLHGGNLDLAPGTGGRGFVGSYDVVAHTDANGHFTIQAPSLFEGYQTMRVVVVGAPDVPPQAGLSSSFDHSFRIDSSSAGVGLVTQPLPPGVPLMAVSLTPGGTPLPLSGTNLPSLSTLSLDVVDPSNPTSGPLATPAQFTFPAADPSTVADLRNYSLFNAAGQDLSQFIASATFVATDTTFGPGTSPARLNAAYPNTGRIDMTFKPGLPMGRYVLVVHGKPSATYPGIRDAAGNPIDDSWFQGPNFPDFTFSFSLKSQPVFITDMSLQNSSGAAIGGPRSYFEVPAANATPRAPAPPTTVVIDFSTPLMPTADYSTAVQLIGSADNQGGAADGDFGTLGQGGLGSTGSGFSVVPGTTVRLVDPSNPNLKPTDPGFSGTRLVLQLASGTTLTPDNYRIYLPNTGANIITDIYGHQLDGEFLGNLAANNSYIANTSFNGYTASPSTATGNYLPPSYEDQIADDIVGGVSQYRQSDMSGDGVAGGAFMTGFTVVPNGNVIFARPDYVEDPSRPATIADGSLAKPYPVLAPQATATATNGGNLNDPSNFFNFNPAFDLAGIGHFASSAFYAAQVKSANGPVVIVALPATPKRDPVTGAITLSTYALQSPTDGSASVPFDTTLAFSPGAAMKLLNASLFVQNQGSALEALGGNNPSNHVIFTSTNDNTVGTNSGVPTAAPRGGDWGGIAFRNFDNLDNGRNLQFPVDGPLLGPNGQHAVSGADDIMSLLNFADVRYAGGAVPATQGIRYDAVTLYNSRPTLTNDNISIPNSNTAGAQAAISGDFDSFREDDIARGPLIRRTTVANYSLNGIWVRPNITSGLTGVAEQTNATLNPSNPSTLGGNQNFTFDDPLPYILTSQLLVGEGLLVGTGGQTNFVNNRLYVQPGVIVKSGGGAGISVVNNDASLNVGSRTYINQYDADPNFNSNSPNFQAEGMGDAQVLFTSLYDHNATTPLIPTPIDSANDAKNPLGPFAYQPNLSGPSSAVPAPARWGSVGIQSGAVAVINDAEFRFGGGQINDPTGTLPSQSVLAFITEQTDLSTPLSSGQGGGGRFGFGLLSPLAQLGTHAIITNNNFFDNFDTAMQIEPNGLLAADPTRPLASGNPFFRNNLMQRNDIDGMAVVTSRTYTVSKDRTTVLRPQEGTMGNGSFNLTVNSVWDDTDLTYVLRGTVVLAGYYDPFGFGGPAPVPGTTFGPEQKPFITLTVQSLLPGTRLPDGSVIASPGESPVVKMMNDFAPWNAGNLGTYGSTGASIPTGASVDGGAGFIVGVDDGVDPPSNTGSPLIDPGAGSQIRFLGIAGNETTGQQRVPVILTSLRDNTVGVTVRGIKEFKIYNNDSIQLQGGGIVDQDPTAALDWLTTKLGQTPGTQFNSDMAMTISNSNLSGFSDAAVFVHPTGANSLIRLPGIGGGTPVVVRAGQASTQSVKGEGAVLYMVNDTVTNSSVGVQANSETTDATTLPSPIELVMLNNTFYNDTIAQHTVAPNSGGTIPAEDSVYWLSMDNIYSNSSNTALLSDGQEFGSQAQYNLYWQNGINLVLNGSNIANFQGNFGAVSGNPQFRNPATGDFRLLANSAAIDASRSEIGPLPAGDAIYPTVNQVLTGTTGGIRTNPATLTPPSTPGRSNPFGGTGFISDPRKQVTLPGTPGRGFDDNWVPVLTSDPNAKLGPASNAGTFAYAPITGERDLLGNLRQDDLSVPNVGAGSRPWFDIGAYEFRQYFPPEVVPFSSSANVLATLPGGVTRDFYTVGGISGANQAPQTIQIKFNHQLDPTTINGSTVLLVGSGGDGTFGNGNDVPFNLTGRLSYDASTAVLTINSAGLVLPTDEYEITLSGNGANVLKDQQGNALDGENTTNNDDPNGTQQALPSGDQFPGGNFYLKFTINAQAPSLVPGTFHMAPSTDSNRVGDQITNDHTPAFTGRITVASPLIAPLQGDTVFLDVLDQATGQWVQVGQSTTDASGNFTVAVNSPLPDTLYNVGPDGLLGTPDDQNFDVARVRIVDQAGNVSAQFTDPFSTFLAQGAATAFVVDTAAPQLTGFAPAPGSLITSGPPTFAFTVNKNLDPNSLNPSTVTVVRAGADGVFGTADDVFVPLTGVNFTVKPLMNGPQGPEIVSFTLPAGLPNDQYLVVLRGSGSNPITDIAGNALNGSGTPGSDINFRFVVDNPAENHIIYAGQTTDISDATAPQGSRENPFLAINDAIAAAGVGDTVGVLPGTYTENVVMKSLVRIQSAASTSTDSSLQPGNALQTVIRTGPNSNVAVSATNLFSVTGLSTEMDGFTIVSPLLGSQASGAIDPTSVGVSITNSTVVFARNIVMTSGIGVLATTSGLNAATPFIQADVLVGNIFGMVVNDAGTGSVQAPMDLDGNTIADNTVGLLANVGPTSPDVANVGDNIFWENHDQTPSRNGAAIQANAPNKIALRGNLFSGNGPSDTDPSDDVLGVGGGFIPSNLGPTPDQFGNFTGNPAFVAPRDPRPGADGPAAFFIDANYDLTAASAAIDAAIPGFQPTYDFLYRSRVRIPGRGFPGTGPGDVGAYEYSGGGGLAVGGAFRVASTSLSGDGSPLANGRSISAQAMGNDVIVDFSASVDPSTVDPTDLVLSGNGLDPANPAHAVSLNWIDAHTVEFMLAGGFNSTGAVNASIPAGSILSASHQPLLGFSDSVQLGETAASATPPPANPPSQNGATPVPAASPTTIGPGRVRLPHGKRAHVIKVRPVQHHVVRVRPAQHHVVRIKPVQHHAKPAPRRRHR